MNDECFLVTGAGGFVGGHVARLLIDNGVKVRGMVRNAQKAADLKKIGVELVEADLSDAASLAPAVEGITGVYHIASLFRQAEFPESVFHDTNAEGTRRMLEASIAAGVKRFVHCSTGGVLGHISDPPGTEESQLNPGDMYQRSKLEGEKIALEYFRGGRIPGVVIRPAMVYGPGDTRNLKLFKMVAKRQFFYVGDGQTHVHFVDVRDLAKAFVLAMKHDELNGEVYIISGAKAVTQQCIAECIANELNVRPPWLHLPVKPMQWMGSLCEAMCRPLRIPPPLHRRRVDFFTKNRHFSSAKAERDMGYSPAQNLEGEVADTCAWYKAQGWF